MTNRKTIITCPICRKPIPHSSLFKHITGSTIGSHSYSKDLANYILEQSYNQKILRTDTSDLSHKAQLSLL